MNPYTPHYLGEQDSGRTDREGWPLGLDVKPLAIDREYIPRHVAESIEVLLRHVRKRSSPPPTSAALAVLLAP